MSTPTDRPQAIGTGDVRSVAGAMYDALLARDVGTLAALLHPSFTGQVSAGMPLGVGGPVSGPEQMLVGVWGTIASAYDAGPEPEEFLVADHRVVVFGHYRGRHRGTGRAFTAAFGHDLVVRENKIVSLVQITDTVPWHEAARRDG